MSIFRPAGLKKRKDPEGLSENMINQTLHNRYHITALLGKGAMGTVYRATGKGK